MCELMLFARLLFSLMMVATAACRDVPTYGTDELTQPRNDDDDDRAHAAAQQRDTDAASAIDAAAVDAGRDDARASGPAGSAPQSVHDDSAELYDERRVPRFDIELPEASRTALRRDPDTYVRATLRYGSEVVRDVGLRIKGEGSLRTLDKKAAFKIKLDEFVPGQSFRGLRRLTLNNMVEDPSFLAERLAYHLFRAAKLPAPRCNSALVYVNGVEYGLYANVETEDKAFLRRWFARDEGNLYEEGQVDFEPGAERKFDLETNEAQNDRSDLTRLIEVISARPPTRAPLDAWNAVLDTEHFLRFTAAEAAVNQWDMYGYTVFYPNNFRLYHDPASDQFVFLPWGMDLSMKPYRDSGRKHIPIFGIARQYDRPSNKITAGKLFQQCLKDAACKARYAAVVREIVDLYQAADLEARAAAYYAQVAPLVARDPRKEYTREQFEAGYAALLATIRTRPGAMRDELAQDTF